MKEKIIIIAKLFGDASEAIIKEDYQGLECSISFILTKKPSLKVLHEDLPNISERDTWRLRLLSETDDDLFDLRTGSQIDADYDSSKLEPYLNNEVRLVYSIDKNKVDGILTIYDYSVFFEYLQALYAHDFISILKNNLDNQLIFEVWEGEAERFSTSSIAIIRRGDSVPSLSKEVQKAKRVDDCREQCQWNNKLSDLLPEDVHIIQRKETGKLAGLFDQMCVLLCALYVADFSSVDKNGIKLRMSGFKMMVTEIASSKLSTLSFNTESLEQWYNIYDWCYTGGYTTDRLSIARNLITLNSSDTNKLLLNASTYDAIKSNFKIFEKDNVRQYIKVRNDVSKDLLDLQDKINSIVEGFTSDFRKNIVGLGTFFLTLVVVRVVANGQWAGAFSNQVVFLSFVFVLLSAVILVFSRQTLDKKERLYSKHYIQLRERYQPLLSQEEADKIFEDGDPNKFGTHLNYIKWQKKRYTWFWGITLGVFTLFLVFAWCWNLFETTNLYKLIKTILECCTKNI